MAAQFPRVIKDLYGASLSNEVPPHAKLQKGRMNSKQRAGLTYEKRVTRSLKRAIGPQGHLPHGVLRAGQWISFTDSNGPGWAQPDLYHWVEEAGLLFILECKLTQTPVAEWQLEHLYRPLLAHILRPDEVVMLQICKNLRPGAQPKLVSGPREALELTRRRGGPMPYVWHYRGDY